MGRHRLVLLSQKDYKEKVLRDMVNLIEKRWIRGNDTILRDVQEVFKKPPYNMSDRTVRLYLDELVENRKINTWRKEGYRYYAPRISMPLKIVTASVAVIILCGVVIDLVLPESMLLDYVYFNHIVGRISTLPIVVYCVVLMLIYTVVWNVAWLRTERKMRR